MIDWDDYHAFISTSGSGDDHTSPDSSGGCLPAILIVLAILGLIGKIVG